MRASGRRAGTVRAATIGLALVLAAGCSLRDGGAPGRSTGAASDPPASAAPTTPAAVMPPDLLAPAEPGTCRPDLRPGWLRRENARPGTPLVRTTDHPEAKLYLDTVSAVCGQAVRVAVSAPPGRYQLRAVRVGWYGGRGGRVVATSGYLTATRQPDARGTDTAGSPRWRNTTSITVGPGWPPGMYVVQLFSGGQLRSMAPLVVRAPSSARRSPEIFVVAGMTWTAYDEYGGRSLYHAMHLSGRAGFEGRARTASLARPVVGAGVVKVFVDSASTVRAVERAGADVDYAADLDVDARPSLLTGRAAVLTGSHTEYVTRRIVDAFAAARDAGSNLAFLGGNQFYWQALVTRDAAGRPTTVTVHREAREDPLIRSHPDLVTVRWRDPPVNRPEARLLGAQYTHLGVVIPLVVQVAPAWLGWRRGEVVPAGAASEVDALVPGVSPAGTRVLAAGAAMAQHREVRATVTYYVAPSGAAVLDAANVSLGCTTAGSCEHFPVPPRATAFWSASVVRIVRAFATPRFGQSHPAAGVAGAPSYQQLLRRYGPAGVGRAISGNED
jgi:hypothetical protein